MLTTAKDSDGVLESWGACSLWERQAHDTEIKGLRERTEACLGIKEV